VFSCPVGIFIAAAVRLAAADEPPVCRAAVAGTRNRSSAGSRARRGHQREADQDGADAAGVEVVRADQLERRGIDERRARLPGHECDHPARVPLHVLAPVCVVVIEAATGSNPASSTSIAERNTSSQIMRALTTSATIPKKIASTGASAAR
jgi:hypothetical protein